ncbi:hypothetical protein FDP41_012313 [Naegleria fowleri]|uniref:ORC1/DEAH AAA+ ATPase domain-containing protein n=1 Tax=Naegleria fowleri TaxID=5763 RepID=A0A6A5C1V5_NAEFO|nr:uncharacterized protein FDP41_012313 [Naegleria fowleri]KAF0981656.1 hypothetical protein FDP41_012313 [Naegleria fowleri]
MKRVRRPTAKSHPVNTFNEHQTLNSDRDAEEPHHDDIHKTNDDHEYEGDSDEERVDTYSQSDDERLDSEFTTSDHHSNSTTTTNTNTISTNTTSNAHHLKQIYQQALVHFKEECLDTIPQTRTKPYQSLIEKIDSCIHRSKGMVIYVFGKSGTGKSFTIKKLIHDIQQDSQKMKHLYSTIPIIDCIAEEVNSLQRLCNQLHEHFNKRDSLSTRNKKSVKASNLFSNSTNNNNSKKKKNKLRLIILDSADQLLKNQKVKEHIQKWSQQSSCIFILVTCTQILSHDDDLILFTPIPSEELQVILQSKLKFLLQRTTPPTIDSNLISIISKHFDEFDLRHVLKLIQIVLTTCMEQLRPCVDMAVFFQTAAQQVSKSNPVTLISQLTLPQQRLLEILTRKEGIVRNEQEYRRTIQQEYQRKRRRQQQVLCSSSSSSSSNPIIISNTTSTTNITGAATTTITTNTFTTTTFTTNTFTTNTFTTTTCLPPPPSPPLSSSSSESEEVVMNYPQDLLVFHETVSLDHVVRIYQDYMKDFTNERITFQEVKEMCRVLDDLKLVKCGVMNNMEQQHVEEDPRLWSQCLVSAVHHHHHHHRQEHSSSSQQQPPQKDHLVIETVTVLVSYETVQEGIANRRERMAREV